MPDYHGIKNTGKAVYTEKFDGETITIHPGETIRMSRSKAVKFMSTRPSAGVKVDGMNQLLPESIKSLERVWHEPVEQEVFVSPRNGERYLTEASMLEEDAKYEVTEELANVHACPSCAFTSESAEIVLEHIGEEHTGDSKRNISASPAAI